MDKNIELSLRQAKLLATIVREHSKTGKPVSSKELVEKGYFESSAATIRNEMQVLEKDGYIFQPHTSSGRIPTDKGFRYFVNILMERVALSVKEQDRLRKELFKLQLTQVELGRRIAKLLSEHSEQASFTLLPDEVSTVGLSNILESSDLPEEDAREIVKFFDQIDEHAEELIREYGDKKPEAYIGKELKLSKTSGHSMIVSGLTLPSGKKGVIGLIGSKSMKYEKNLSLMEYIAKLLKTGTLIAILFLIR